MGEQTQLLLVEDSDDDEWLLRLALEDFGMTCAVHRVVTRRDLYDALDRSVPYDVAVTDDGLPDLCALEVVDILQAERPGLPVVVVSGTIDQEVAVRAMRQGASDYLMKGDLGRLGPVIERERSRHTSRRRQAEEAAARDAYFRDMISALPQLVLRLDEKGTVLDYFGGTEVGWRPEVGHALDGGVQADGTALVAEARRRGWQRVLPSGEIMLVIHEE